LTNSTIHKTPLKRNNNTWARSNKEKADTLAEHFKTSFTNDMDNGNAELPTQITNLNFAIKKLKIIEPTLKQKNIIPPHQFGFQKQHSTIQQVHRVNNKITGDFEKRNFTMLCTCTLLKHLTKYATKDCCIS